MFKHMLLQDANEEGEEFEPRINDELFSLDLAEVSQCVLPGNNRHEVELQFPESDTVEAGTDQLGEWPGYKDRRLYPYLVFVSNPSLSFSLSNNSLSKIVHSSSSRFRKF